MGRRARFSPDGTHIAYTYSNGDPQINLTRLFVTTPSGGIGTAISAAIDRPIDDAAWLHDSKGLVVTTPDRTTNALYRLSLQGAYERIALGNLTPGNPQVTTGGASSPSLGAALAND